MRSPFGESTNRALSKWFLLLVALTWGTAGCGSQRDAVPAQQEDDFSSASFSIQPADFYSSSHVSQARLFSASSRHSAQGFSFSDVSSIRIDVNEKDSGTPLYLNLYLTLVSNQWSGTIPFLPKSKVLVFSAKAFNASKVLLFQGTTEQALFGSNDKVVLTLAAANDGQSISIPRIKKISVPSAFSSNQRGTVSFSMEANMGETLTYEITPAVGGGTLHPLAGSIALGASAGTFVSQYIPPTVSAESEFEHTVKVTNAVGHSVITSFKTKVKPPGTLDGVSDSVVQVLFSPVINSITTRRFQGTGNILFLASVADDEAAAELGFSWTFTQALDSAVEPAPAFPTGTTNPSTLENYTAVVKGTVKLEVVDSKGGKTTLFYPLAVNQFPDNPVTEEGPVSGLNIIAAGDSYTCVMLNGGTMRCWGNNTYGQLGYGNTGTVGDSEKPYTAGDIPLAGIGGGIKVAVGGNHACALLESGLVRCWGNNTYGQLGYNTVEHVGDGEAISHYGYVNVGGFVVKIAAGSWHTCALLDTGKVRCWGLNNYGQLGYGNTQNIGDNEHPWTAGDVQVGGIVKDIAAGFDHTCALLEGGKVRCWGFNNYGQLGYGNTQLIGDNEHPSVAGDVNVGGSVQQLATGYYNTCALLTTGYVRCWGYNGSGQLGYGHASNVNSPLSAGDVNTGGKVFQVAMGQHHTCALLNSGSVKCWGNGGGGRLGYGNTVDYVSPPSATVNLGGAIAFQIAAGYSHSCVQLSTGAARCWGTNNYGQLGYGHTQAIGDNEHPFTAGDIQFLEP
ncbi:RCC1 domain-containing protein [Stigmatella aurantiaca]